jgi:hypothetical protein
MYAQQVTIVSTLSAYICYEHYLDDVAVKLAGRAAEDVCCGTISSASSRDLERVRTNRSHAVSWVVYNAAHKCSRDVCLCHP